MRELTRRTEPTLARVRPELAERGGRLARELDSGLGLGLALFGLAAGARAG